ncbi:hypothetical protein Pedsa_0158 [Pseudopedobacter saltans DSM 12145]|uniref:DUF479 domain-containing protein n=1 Tax=Pseudopedobacter saltans (strain ATCC 51119 / DSM 12145 / JCM 21818 / CCUG 39354 / LMG 10337 / NBRC 100064 / NCIMB 13643) TaxID=762903 RepID=F0SDL7_PSESL|nr:hypothetical protein [Pseudopedobacter saltans]ADY50744.1 hypothetical protein Pedsa_0158 [Pseudopedobacter saltans DSM 12145]
MNFLSHYYFDKNESDSYKVLGAVLPDLLKNANKNWKLFPEKTSEKLYHNSELKALITGWKKHLAVDKIFHNTSSFFYHQHELKNHFTTILAGTPIKPFFVGHVGYELCLDHLLLKYKTIDINRFYKHLKSIDYKAIEEFLRINDIVETDIFLKYYSSFVKEAYLGTYIKPESISYALKRICMRVWATPLSDYKKEEMTKVISSYISLLDENFMFIFDEIEALLINE